MKKIILGTLLLTMVFAFTACSNKNNEGNTDTKEDTRIATDLKGEVEIPAEPKRIVDLSGASDILSILGFDVVGTANSDGYDYTKFPSYLEEELSGATILGYSMSDTFDIEAIMALEPDLIIISTVQEKIYSQLSEIAPTLMVAMEQVDWRVDFMHVAKVMDKEAEATEWIAAYDKKVAEVTARIKETYGEDATYLSFLASYGSIYIFDGAGIGSIFYDDMGLKRPENLPQQENISLPVVTMEGLAEIDADFVFAVATEEDFAVLEADSIWNEMTAVKEGHVISLPASPYFNIGYSPIGRLVFIEEIETYLSQINE